MTDDFAKYGFPDGKRYNSFVGYFKRKYGERLQKIVLDAGFTCPNRDGKLDSRGCIFCSAGGSGDFAGDRRLSIREQISEAKQLVSRKHTGSSYIAYFQAFTNTYADVEYLDHDNKYVYYYSAEVSSAERHLCRVNIVTGKSTRLTHTEGWHQCQLSTDKRYFTDNYSSLNTLTL